MNQELITSDDLDDVMTQAIATGLLSSHCTIQTASGDFGPSGAPDGLYVNLAGHVDIECQAAPLTMDRGIGGSEIQTVPELMTKQPLHVLLDDYYPLITTTMRAVLDGVDYDIEAVERDSQKRMSRLLLTRNEI